MLRVRVDGGALTTEQTRVIGEVSRDYARGTADITDRQNIQLHWVRVEDVPAIWERLEGVGLLTTEACGDCPRVILGSPGRRHLPGRAGRPDAGDRGDPASLHRRPGVLQPAAQVQVRDHRHAHQRRRARDQRHLVRRGRAPRARPRLRPVGRRRPLDQPAAGRAARRVRGRGRRARRVGRRGVRLPRLRLPPDAAQGAAEVPARRLGPGEVPRGARDRVPQARRCPTGRRRPPPRTAATTSASTSRRTAAATSAPRPSWAASPASC